MANKTMNIGNASNLVNVGITGNLSVTSTVTASTFVGALSKAITIGGKSYDGHEAISISATDLGLSNAMHFVGTTTVTNPTGNYNNGDVILNTSTKKEYVYNNGTWIELGDEGSYVLKETGKGLSTNDYTTAEKTKLAGLSNYTLQTATSSTLGGVKIGSTLTINSGVVDVKPATSSTLGGIKAGDNITIASDGTLSIGGYLPLSGGTLTGKLTIDGVGISDGSDDAIGLTVQTASTGNAGAITGIQMRRTDLNRSIVMGVNDTKEGIWSVDQSAWIIYATADGKARTDMALYGAVWNDYAEFRNCSNGEAGHCVVENGDDTMSLSTKRLQYGGIISDTFGFVIGDQKNGKPIAVSGRVLAYTDKDRKNFKPGDAVCSGPNGSVSKMTRKEIKEYPEKILGIVSSVPTYEFWGPKQIPVDGRIWIKVR